MWIRNSAEAACCQPPPPPKPMAGWGEPRQTAHTRPTDLWLETSKAGGSSGSLRGARGLWRWRRKRRGITNRCWGHWPTRRSRHTPGPDSAQEGRTTATPPTPNQAKARWSPAWNDATPTSWGATHLSAGAMGPTSSAEVCLPPDGLSKNKLHCVSRKRTTVALCTFIFFGRIIKKKKKCLD